ncbi:hypothetical protein RJT34_24884 [Clitoria ternatea]|uniref:Uncharacterized protein n=1 Tax=Clitoria ternatea TaxID=43366 RepID=A0AAN9FRJ8_CLITE
MTITSSPPGIVGLKSSSENDTTGANTPSLKGRLSLVNWHIPVTSMSEPIAVCWSCLPTACALACPYGRPRAFASPPYNSMPAFHEEIRTSPRQKGRIHAN